MSDIEKDFEDNANAITQPAADPERKPKRPNETDGDSPTKTNTAEGSKGNKYGGPA